MNKKQILSAFSNLNIQMIEFLERKIPNNIDVSTMKNSLITLINTNPTLNIRTFITCTVNRFRNHIENRDYVFFEKFEDDEVIEDMGIALLVFDKMKELRPNITNLSHEDKCKLMDYLLKLLKLSDLYDLKNT